MRFLFTAPFYRPAAHAGGLVSALEALAEELVRRGNAVTVVASNMDMGRVLDVPTATPCDLNGVRVWYFPTRPYWWQRLPIRRLRRTVVFRFSRQQHEWLRHRLRTFDIVESQISFLESNGLCARLARHHGRPYIYRQQGNLDPDKFGRNAALKRLFIRFRELDVLRQADVLLALSKREATVYGSWIHGKRIEIIPNGIRLDEWTTPATPSAGLRAMLDATQDGVRCVWMARFSRHKAPDLFIGAMAECVARHPQASAILAGPDNDPGLRQGCQTMVRSLGLESKIYITGPLEGADRVALLQQASVFVLPTAGEGFSMALLEAMACGCAVVTTPEANFPELAEQNAGILCARTVPDLTEALASLLGRPRDAIRAMGENGRRLVADRYDIRVVARQYVQLAEELAETLKR